VPEASPSENAAAADQITLLAGFLLIASLLIVVLTGQVAETVGAALGISRPRYVWDAPSGRSWCCW
jgi:hypothetical protein